MMKQISFDGGAEIRVGDFLVVVKPWESFLRVTIHDPALYEHHYEKSKLRYIRVDNSELFLAQIEEEEGPCQAYDELLADYQEKCLDYDEVVRKLQRLSALVDAMVEEK